MTPNLLLGSICLLVTLVALVLVARTVTRMVRLVRAGQPDPTRRGPWRARTRHLAREAVGHRRLRRRPVVGIMHWLVMVGFLGLVPSLLIAYAEVFVPAASWPLIGRWAPYELLVELLGIATVAGIGVLILIRQWHHPRRAGRASRFAGSHLGHAYFVEAVVALEGIGVLGVQASAVAAGFADPPLWAAPLSQSLGRLLPPAPILVSIMAAIKILVAMTWVIVVAATPTMGVAWHRFTAFVNLYARRRADGRPALGAARPMMSGGRVLDLERADPDRDVFGVGVIEDLSWKGLLDTVTCTECGRCQDLCPAWGTGRPLSPKLLVTGLRAALFDQAPRMLAGAAEPGPALVGQAADAPPVPEDVLWACTTCGACVDACPVGIEHVDHILDLRRHRVLLESEFPRELAGVFRNLENRSNPWGLPQRERLAWAEGLALEVPLVGQRGSGAVDYVFWVGCAGALDERARSTTRAVVELLAAAGVSYAVLGPAETCCGDPARRAGNEFLYQSLAATAIAALDEAFVGHDPADRRIVTTCPHCLNTLGNEYPDLGGHYRVVHHTELLAELVGQGRLTPVASPATVTYHDPCYLGRHNQIYQPPRSLLVATGAQLAEMTHAAERSMCCGAGGGRMWMDESGGTRINLARVDEALDTEATTIVTGCPFCRLMISDGLTTRQDEGAPRAREVRTTDLAEYLLRAIQPADHLE